MCEAATLVHVWVVTRSAGSGEGGGGKGGVLGMGMGIGMGIWGGAGWRRRNVREPGLSDSIWTWEVEIFEDDS